MPNIIPLPEEFSQNTQLPIRIVAPDFGHLALPSTNTYQSAHRLPYYFFLFILKGSSSQHLDGETFELGKHEMLFALPHQIRHAPINGQAKDYYNRTYAKDENE